MNTIFLIFFNSPSDRHLYHSNLAAKSVMYVWHKQVA